MVSNDQNQYCDAIETKLMKKKTKLKLLQKFAELKQLIEKVTKKSLKSIVKKIAPKIIPKSQINFKFQGCQKVSTYP